MIDFGKSGSGGRTQALALGLPSLVAFIIGVVLLGMAEFGSTKELEEHYLFEAEKSGKEKKRLIVELNNARRMLSVSQRSDRGRPDELIPEDDPRRVELESNRGKETVYLEKLISLNNEEPEYKYKLALAFIEQEESRARGLAMLRSISPADEPGHVGGHLFLASYYMKVRTDSRSQAIQNAKLAFEHVESCLRRDSGNVRALKMKAQLLYLKQKFAEAYVVFEKLFETDPIYAESLIDLNKRLNKEGRNTKIISRAIDLFDKKLRDSQELTDSDRVRIFQELTKCHLARDDFETIEKRLLAEVELQSSNVENSGKRVWAEHLLSHVYANWLRMFPLADPANIRDRLVLMKKAYVYNSKNEYILRELAYLGNHQNDAVAQAARSVYDPTLHNDAPALVLNELGTQALSRSEYESALSYFERARKKAPRMPEILNNLSYAYLIGDNPNAKRALKLVDEALKYLPQTQGGEAYRTHFHDTRGKALMQLGLVSEAVAEFEFALRGRPGNEGILESLIKCYRANEMDPGPYERQLARIREQNVEAQDSNAPNK